MIYLFSGTPGSGKSYDAMRTIYRHLKRGKPVIANFEVMIDESLARRFTCLENSRITFDYLADFACDYWDGRKFAEDEILLVCDEAQLLWNSRTWAENDRLEMLKFMSQHRKFGYKIVLIAQSDVMIDKQFRELIEVEVNHRKVRNYGFFGRCICWLTFSQWFIARELYYQQRNYQLDTEWIRYSPRIGGMYNSYKSFQGRAVAGAPAPGAALLEPGMVGRATFGGDV